jgi:hypothetical protein
VTGGSGADGAVAQTTGQDVDPLRCGVETKHVLRSPACFDTGGAFLLWRTTVSVTNWGGTWRYGWLLFYDNVEAGVERDDLLCREKEKGIGG